ncbi:GNAT family N-acetyltransferase [Paenibacillus kobensis]|uniref:GNAT family N-acetyltransferase n=1 Tax=Paenibacillus kobensis TaxID=59841 RepID=UPI000FDC88EA|nr:GNAT family N-acetyltransferase [Paenibacillus kobensis]
MTIRPLVHEDEQQVMRLMAEHTLQFPDFVIQKYPERWSVYLNEERNDRCGYWVMEDDRLGVVGHAGFIMSEDGDYEIVGVVVRKDQARRGIGRELIDTVCRYIADEGASSVMLTTLGHADNGAVILFYQGIGFDLVREETDYFIPGYHRVTFSKPL